MVPAEVNPGLREIALRGVHACSKGRAFLRDALGREFEKSSFPPRLRAAAGDLASGVVRRRLTLDHLIAPCSRLPLRKVHPLLLDILRLAAYEILFVERIPARASVSEAVNLAKRLVRPEFAGFANAVLRHLIRDIEATAGIDGPFRPSARELRIGPRRVVRFHRDVFPDPGTDAVGWLVSAGGVPRWLVERWMRNFARDGAFQIVEASNSTPPVTVRVNALRTDTEALRTKLAALGVRTSAGEIENCLRIETPVELSALDSFAAGEFYIQDETSMRGPRLLAPRVGDKVLDLCSAPGGKATQLAELTGDRADIYALDLSPERLKLVEENTRRLGIERLRTAVGDARKRPVKMRGAFDAVLADVPCSNTGVLRRRVEARHRLRAQDIAELARTQAEILRTALAAAREGGRMVYSTCSLEPEENGDVVRRVLAETRAWRLDVEETLLPRPEGPDGGYVARIVS